MRIPPAFGDCAIVLVGHFTPAIFSARWFLDHGLCSEDEAAQATLNGTVIVPDLTTITLGTKAIVAERNRFQIMTAEAPWIVIADLVVKMFKEVLFATPVFQMGINRQIHFSVGSEEERNRIGRLLAPLEPWGAKQKAERS